MKLNFRDIKILTGFELRQLLRAPQGVMALCFLFFPMFWIMSKLSDWASDINGFVGQSMMADNLTQNPMGAMVKETVFSWFGLDAEVVNRLVNGHSLFVILLFVATAYGMPFLTMIAALDQNGTDIGNKGIRFYLPRTSRENLLVGRFLGTFIFWIMGILLAGVAAVIMAISLEEHHSMGVVLLDGLWFSGALILVALPFVAFMAFCSVSTGSPLLAITMGLGIYLGVGLVGGVGGWVNEALEVIDYVFPTPFRKDLMLGSMGQGLVAVIAMLGYTVLYLFGAGWIMRKRDL